MSTLPDPLEHRTADHPIESLLLKRWSPRAMNGQPVAQSDLQRLFEAARWAPSSYNEQEWRYLYAHRESSHWSTYFGLLMDANQIWCERAGVLIVIASRKTFTRNNKPNGVHSFDTGASFQNLALQGTAMGLVVHPMAGFDKQKASRELKIPEEYHVEAMVAVGHPGSPDDLPEHYRDIETPSDRKPISQIACEGIFSL